MSRRGNAPIDPSIADMNWSATKYSIPAEERMWIANDNLTASVVRNTSCKAKNPFRLLKKTAAPGHASSLYEVGYVNV